MRCNPVAAQDQVKERPSGAPVAVHEGMDGLELGVGDGRLDQSRKPVVVAEGKQVIQQGRDFLRRRGHEDGGTGIVAAAADPVLHRADASAVFPQAGSGQQTAMHLQKDFQGYLIARSHRAHSPDHGVDVGQHLGGGDVPYLLPHPAGRVGAEQPSSTDHQALDARGCHRLGAQQQPGEGFGVG